MVKMLETKEEFDEMTKSLVILDFTASWCGPCKRIGPYFESFAEKYPTIPAAKIDVDDLDDVAEECGVSSMPTFQVRSNTAMFAESRKAASQASGTFTLNTPHEGPAFEVVCRSANHALTVTCRVRNLARTQVWKNGIKVEEMVGASEDRLEALFKKYS
eukprot:SAG31_NODE_401_length_16206_cov_10.920780_4_plen_159_part_00